MSIIYLQKIYEGNEEIRIAYSEIEAVREEARGFKRIKIKTRVKRKSKPNPALETELTNPAPGFIPGIGAG